MSSAKSMLKEPDDIVESDNNIHRFTNSELDELVSQVFAARRELDSQTDKDDNSKLHLMIERHQQIVQSILSRRKLDKK